jgi:hypothetical protein
VGDNGDIANAGIQKSDAFLGVLIYYFTMYLRFRSQLVSQR